MSDDHSQENHPTSDTDTDVGKAGGTAGFRRFVQLVQRIEAEPPSKRFLILFVGLLGVLLIVLSVFFGVYSLFAPSHLPSDDENLAEAFVGLDATIKANNAKINAELSLIIDDGASSTHLMNIGVPKENDLALLMREEFRGINWETDLPTLRRYIARKPWQVGFLEVKSVRPLLSLHDTKREKIREMLDNPDVDMQLAYHLDQYGFAVEKKDRDNLWAYVHLEEYELARALIGLTLQEIQELNAPPDQTNPNLTQALKTLQYIMKAAEIASRQKEMNLRFDAAYIRENALDTLQSLVNNPRFGLHDAKSVLDMLDEQLATWPSDRFAFEGERASAVWLYEQTRRGRLLDNIADQDIATLQQLGSLADVERLVMRHIDADELYYLARMSEVIFTCRERYFERTPLLSQWEHELEVMKGDLNSYPILAGTVLLRDVRTIRYRLAADRARTEAWSLVLRVALRQPSDHAAVHPITGQPYHITVETNPNLHSQHKTVITVRWLETEEPITVPGYAGGA